jgi:N-acetyl sugar amidotransferase
VPEVRFDEQGECNFCKLHDALARDCPADEQGARILERMVSGLKQQGRGKAYDCVIGVSGGTDSTYLMHWAKAQGLRILAVNFDNGWHSEIAVSNIKNSLTKLDVDLRTYVVDHDEMNDILLSYMKAGLPWIDVPSDIALVATLYRVAAQEGIKCIMTGNHFRSEGKQPTPWTYSDGKQLRYLQRRFGTRPLKTFPNQTAARMFYDIVLKGTKLVKPLYYLPYRKHEAMQMLERTYGWRYYGGHHYESLFTKFAITYWQYRKFGIDKRKVTFSAQVRSGEITRDEALRRLQEPPGDPARAEDEKEYVVKKLGIGPGDFQRLWESPNRWFTDYPSYYPLYQRYRKLVRPWYGRLGHRPMMDYMENTAKTAVK